MGEIFHAISHIQSYRWLVLATRLNRRPRFSCRFSLLTPAISPRPEHLMPPRLPIGGPLPLTGQAALDASTVSPPRYRRLALSRSGASPLRPVAVDDDGRGRPQRVRPHSRSAPGWRLGPARWDRAPHAMLSVAGPPRSSHYALGRSYPPPRVARASIAVTVRAVPIPPIRLLDLRARIPA